MADEKSIAKMNKMFHKKTGASFSVVYVIYVSLVYIDSRKTASCLLPRHTIFATFGRQLQCLLVRIQGGLYLFHYVLDNLNWLLFVCITSAVKHRHPVYLPTFLHCSKTGMFVIYHKFTKRFLEVVL